MTILTGDDGDNTLTGGAGNDTITGKGGKDTLIGGDGDDQLASHDVGVASASADPISLDIFAEHDIINGGAGSDDIFAGYGDDVDGGADGYDGDSLFISFLGAPTGITVDFSLTTQSIGGGTITGIENLRWVQGSNFADTINAADNEPHYAGGNSVLGMGGDDHLIAGYYTYVLDGGDGDDLVDGRPGEILTSVHGGAGNDTIYTNLGSSACIAYGDAGNDVIHAYVGAYGGSGNDTIFGYGYPYSSPYGLHGEDGDDTITGSAVNDFITGGSGADTLYGAAGNDSLASGSAIAEYSTNPADDMGLEHDVLSAGDGDDGVWAGYGDDVDGGAGYDTLFLSFGGATAGIDLDTGIFASGNPVTIGGGTIQNIEAIQYLRATEFADSIFVADNDGITSFHLGAGNDVITSLFGDASIFGGDGDDRLITGAAYGQYGNLFDGAAGIDAVDYINATSAVSLQLNEEGNGIAADNFGNTVMNVENIFGSAFADYFRGNSGNNLLAGGSGNDMLDGGGGDDTLNGGAGIDTASYSEATAGVTVNLAIAGAQSTGGAGTDTLIDIEGLIGSNWSDKLTGNAGANILIGGIGNDTLNGGLGDDYLDGGTGNDTLGGGSGNDRILYDPLDTPSRVTGGADSDVLVVQNMAAPTSFNLAGHGFEAAEVTRTDTGANPWSSISEIYNVNWAMVQQTTNNDDGSRVVVDFDVNNAVNTSQVWSSFDPQGRLSSVDQLFDNGTRTFINLDEAGTNPWVQNWFNYDAQGRFDSQDVLYDNGTRTFINVDQANSQTWTQDWFTYDAQGRLDSQDSLWDDGTHTFINFDQAASQTWTQDWFTYDAQGRLDSEDVLWDDGTHTFINFDQDNSQSWSQAWFSYDTQGRLDTQDVHYDDGSRTFYNYDQANSEPFIYAAILYNPDGSPYQQVIAWDNGTTTYSLF
jgi:Ca2+-binding RTX toxin-like protein